ncbi:proteasome maturation protein-like [Oscarella lobularis]|uniref:proteasome maturation protein-like n=1 Tax=Oscarella lobularis TaxID=121494 RepID=UPI003313F570
MSTRTHLLLDADCEPTKELPSAEARMYGSTDPLENSFRRANHVTRTPHPLEKSERNYAKNEEHMRLELLRHVQGLHAPLNLRMERAIAAKVGHMAPLRGSHLLLDVLTGADETIGFDDVLGGANDEFREIAEETDHAKLIRRALNADAAP